MFVAIGFRLSYIRRSDMAEWGSKSFLEEHSHEILAYDHSFKTIHISSFEAKIMGK